jgi:hypothetical protein
MAPLNERWVQATGDGGGFTRATLQALFPEVLFPNFCTSTVYATPRDVGRSDLSRSLSALSKARFLRRG